MEHPKNIKLEVWINTELLSAYISHSTLTYIYHIYSSFIANTW